MFNLGETVQEFESIVNTVSKNKNTIFSHRMLFILYVNLVISV